MKRKSARWIFAMIALALATTFVLFTAAPLLAQEEQPDGQEMEVPPELRAKMEEFKDAAAGLREYTVLLKEDVRQFKAAMQELCQQARSLPRDEKWDLFDEVSAARDEYAGTVKDKIGAARETAGAMKEALSAAKEAWEQDDLAGALSSLDLAIAKVGELEVQLEEARQLLQEILEVMEGLEGGAGAASSSAWTWAV